MLFKKRNHIYQSAIDHIANAFLSQGAESILSLPDYGNDVTEFEGVSVAYGWWLWMKNEKVHHLVIQTDSSAGFGFRYKYLSGVKVIDGHATLMSESELSPYD